MILHWPWPAFPCICALTVPASTREERALYCFQPVTQHPLLSFPLSENPYKVIPVGKIPRCVPCWNSLWWDWALGKGSDINAGLSHVQLDNAVEDKDASHCHGHVPEEQNCLFVKGSTRTAKTQLSVFTSIRGGLPLIQQTKVTMILKGQNMGNC